MTKSPLILIVDDNKNNLQVLGSTLHTEGYRLAMAKNGQDAIKQAKKNAPDIILLDIMMPEIDGYQTCKMLKKDENTKSIPVIFLTAKTETDDIVKGFKVGGVDYITKPFKKEELLVRLKNHLDLRQATKKIAQQAQTLKELNNTKDQMFSIISHDLRSPLAGLKNMLDLLTDKETPTDQDFRESAINIMKATTDSTVNLLENLLFWARSQRGDLEINISRLDLHAIVEENIQLAINTIHQKELKVSNKLPDYELVMGDMNLTKTIVRNLLNNAIKFTPNGESITFSSAHNKNHIQLLVADTGIGISEENLKKLFKNDEQFTTYGTNNEKGSGLGLKLCKSFAEKQEGELTVISEEGKGTTFTLSLPKPPAEQ
jgi:two-component system sensor histidine kinase/response regulator